ncbi:MAG: DinB superfamily protein [Marmoricola sp.]|nr:DinB superfamily protein [Marmoricola sp.]
MLAFLDYHRATFRSKVDGVDAAGLALRIEPSTMTLGGMMKHLTLVEESWFSRVLLGREFGAPWDGIDWESDPDWEWRTGALDPAADLFAAYDSTVAHARADVADVLVEGGLDALSQRESRHGSGHFSLRWILLHMIEEYARHNGHADLLREAVDGQVGE